MRDAADHYPCPSRLMWISKIDAARVSPMSLLLKEFMRVTKFVKCSVWRIQPAGEASTNKLTVLCSCWGNDLYGRPDSFGCMLHHLSIRLRTRSQRSDSYQYILLLTSFDGGLSPALLYAVTEK
jgi:hypothetical protein